MRYFLVNLETCEVGTDSEEVYAFKDDITLSEVDTLCHDLAQDNAESFGVIDRAREDAEESDIDFDEEECYSYSYEEITDMDEDEIVSMYGEINYM